ncbi:unnamed protein product, partial [Effrenium voratum]
YILTTDRVRMAGFEKAIAQHSVCRALEIGCGPWAPLAELCLRQGAEVLAAEGCPKHAAWARRQLRGRAEVLAARAEQLDTEELRSFGPQLLVAELLGYTATRPRCANRPVKKVRPRSWRTCSDVWVRCRRCPEVPAVGWPPCRRCSCQAGICFATGYFMVPGSG